MTYQNIRRGAAAALLLAVAACGENTSAPQPVGPSLTITPLASELYEADVVKLAAVYRDSMGVVVPNAAVTWSISDSTRAELSGNGSLLALRSGTINVTAQSSGLTSTRAITVVRPVLTRIVVSTSAPTLARGDVAPIGVKMEGPGNRWVTGRTVALTSDHPAIATIDAAGRVRGVQAGSATIRATSEGVTGTAQIVITDAGTEFTLTEHDGQPMPFLIAADSVEVFGVREYHEVYLEGGTLKLDGSPLRYTVQIRIREYNVRMVNGQRLLEPRLSTNANDFGTVAYDARGDLQLTSEWVYPRNHILSPNSRGMHMQYQVGSEEPMQLFFTRVAK